MGFGVEGLGFRACPQAEMQEATVSETGCSFDSLPSSGLGLGFRVRVRGLGV